MNELGFLYPELRTKTEIYEYYNKKIFQLLKTLSLIDTGDTEYKNFIRKILNLNYGEAFFKKGELQKYYEEACCQLFLRHKFLFTVTEFEYFAKREFQKLTRSKIYRSVVIGNSVIDLFYPQYKLAIEINGSIHNREFKIKKDCHRDKLLIDNLGIKVVDFCNGHISSRIHRVKNYFKKEKRISITQERILWRNIYLITMAKQMNINELSKKLNINPYDLLRLL